jgi:cathepsin B
MADRICIKTNGKVKPVLSPQQLVSCSQNGGCNGGQMNTYWTFAQNTGVQEESCYPYVSGNFDLPACSAKCSAGQSFGVPFKVNPPTKGYAGHMLVPYKPADWRTNVPLIQYEIMTNGPVQAAFNVPREFMNYQSGVYKCMNCTDTIGGHAIKLTGWGVAADGTKYWIMANSWGT